MLLMQHFARCATALQRLMDMRSPALNDAGIALQTCGDPTLFDIYFTAHDVQDYRSAQHTDPQDNVIWNAVLHDNGIFKSPGKLYPSLVLTQADLDRTEQAFRVAAQALAHHEA